MKKLNFIFLKFFLFTIIYVFYGNFNIYSAEVDKEIYNLLSNNEYIPVLVSLKEENDFNFDLEILKEKVKEKQDLVLSRLSLKDFKIKYKYIATFGFAGDISLEGLKKLSSDENVERIYLDRKLELFLKEGVPLIKGDKVYEIGYKGKGKTIAVLDTGIDYTHPDLGGCFGKGCKVKGGVDIANNDNDPMDNDGHGTAVAGIIASSNTVNRGVAPEANLVAVRVCSGTNCNESTVEAGLDWVLANYQSYGINIVNLSLGSSSVYNNSSKYPCTGDNTAKIITKLSQFNVITVTASGNSGHPNGISYPACVPSAISVGSVYDDNLGSLKWCLDSTCNKTCQDNALKDQITCFTNSDELLDVVAPSYSVTTTGLHNSFIEGFTGTSASTPYVSGAIAIILEVVAFPITTDEVRAILKKNGVLIKDNKNNLTFPRIDLYNSIIGLISDTDSDQILDSFDNCPSISNYDQNDLDQDKIGDTCDNCKEAYNVDQKDNDNDKIGDICDLDADGDNYTKDIDCDDTNPAINPSASEIPGDNIDSNCNGAETCGILNNVTRNYTYFFILSIILFIIFKKSHLKR